MTTHQASCQCGSLSATFDGPPDFVVLCNCQACQKRTGSPFGTGAYFRKAQMTMTGPTGSWQRTADSGRAIENFFCPACATTLYWTLDMRPGYFGVAYGCFETALPDPVRAVWTDEAHSWVKLPTDWPQFPKGTPEPGTIA